MLAIILAAGRGSRLAQYNPDKRPKCLLEFDGESLLQRHLRLLSGLGIEAVHIVTGYKADELHAAVAGMAEKPAVTWHHNERFLEGSTISLQTAAVAMRSGEDVLIMDADVLYDPDILARLVEVRAGNAAAANVFLLDRDFEDGPEPVKIAVNKGTIVEFRKQLPSSLVFDQIGESVGFFRFNPSTAAWLADCCDQYDQQGRGEEPHEEVLRDLVLDSGIPVNIVDISGLVWIEIDFPEDVEKARDIILPAIEEKLR